MNDDETTRVFKRSTKDDSLDTRTTSPLFDVKRNISDDDDDSSTKIFRPGSSKKANDEGATLRGDTDQFSVEPVVGWLVIIDGPGKGNFVKLGFGMNSIGRSQDSRVILDFGDSEISRENHSQLTYDVKNKKFYIQHGGGSNLTYLGDTPVLQPFELTGHEIISIGATKLCFVPFCGPNFNWD